MARSRNIKPGLFKNEILGEADPLLTILFQGLWCLADREGRMEDRPKRIKAEIFPYREIPDFNGYLTVLQQLGFIIRYSVENQPIIQIINFKKHQSPHKTEKPSELPEYCLDSDTCKVTVKAPLNNGSVTDEAALIPDSFNLIPDSLNKQSPPPIRDTDFIKPTLADVEGAVFMAGYKIDCEAFFLHYESNGWTINGRVMDNWRARLGVWAKEEFKRQDKKDTKQPGGSTRERSITEDLTDTSWAEK